MKVSTSGSRQRGRPRTLNTQRVVQAALDLLDEQGSAGLSIRGVAARLGVRPNTLYTYVADRAALERAVVDQLLGQADPTILTGPDGWRERIEQYAHRLRRILLARPAAVGLFFSAPMDGPNTLAVGEGLLAALTEAGLAPEQASRAGYTIITYLLGSAALTVADLPVPEHSDPKPSDPKLRDLEPSDPELSEKELERQRRQRLSAIPSEQLPLTAATVHVAAAWNSQEQFLWGLHRVLDGCTR